MSSDIVVGLSAVVLAVTRDEPRVMTVEVSSSERGAVTVQALQDLYSPLQDGRELPALPFGPLDAHADRTLELALRRWVKGQTNLDLGYVEQLYSFGDLNRFSQTDEGRKRVISIAYLALVREELIARIPGASWRNVCDFLPWEDFRNGGGWPELDRLVVPGLDRWVDEAPTSKLREQRRLRVEMMFGLRGAAWDGDRVLERYELLYEVGLVQEAGNLEGLGHAMGLDHRRILATALGRLRGKLRYRPVVFETLPDEFTLLQLQRTVESLAGVVLHKQNFRRLVEQGGIVEGTSRLTRARGRPAELFRFRREVLRERPAPGVGLPRS